MSDDLSDLYQEVLLDHNRHPRNRRRLANPTASADGDNPLCGDRVHLDLRLDPQGRIAEAAFDGDGCAISIASASLLTEAVTGRTPEQARALFAEVHAMLTGERETPPSVAKLAALGGVREYPMRVKCATLVWHTLLAALAASGTARPAGG